MTFSNMAGLKKRIFSEIDQNWKKKSIFSLKKFQISQCHPVFCLWRREMVFQTCPESFSTIADTFQNGDLKYFEVAITPLPSNFDGSPFPHLRGTLGFFLHQNDRNGCKRDVLDARGHFFFAFLCGQRQTVRGVVTTPLVGRGLRLASQNYQHLFET